MINIKIMIIIPSGQLGLSCYQLADSLSTWSRFFSFFFFSFFLFSFFLFSSFFWSPHSSLPHSFDTHTRALAAVLPAAAFLVCLRLNLIRLRIILVRLPATLELSCQQVEVQASSFINTICIFLLITIIVTIVINVIMLNFVTIAMEISFRLDTVGTVTNAFKRCQV